MRADRLITLILTLQHQGRITCKTLSQKLGVSRRTVLRDIEALSFAGIPVVAEGGPGGGIWLLEEYRTSLTGLKDEEVRALFLSRDSALLGDLGWGKAFDQSQLKLNATISDRSRIEVENVQKRLLIDSRWWWHQEQSEDTLGELQKVVFSDTIISFDYEHYDGSKDKVKADAYALVAKAGLWYLIGCVENDYDCYRVSRISGLKSDEKQFCRDQNFDIRIWWPKQVDRFAHDLTSFLCILSVPKDDVRLIQRMAPGRSRIVKEGERSEVEIGVESQWYAQMIVFGLGPACKVISPKELELSFLKRVREIIKTVHPT